jgi:hypothetical protein
MTRVPNDLKDHLLSGPVLSGIKSGYVEAADLFFALWLESINGLTVSGASAAFLTQDEGAKDINS